MSGAIIQGVFFYWSPLNLAMFKSLYKIPYSNFFFIGFYYRVSHDTGHPEIWLSPSPFINMNWTPENFLSAKFSKCQIVKHPEEELQKKYYILKSSEFNFLKGR